MRLELPGWGSGGRPKRRFMDVVKEDMKLVGVREKDAECRVRCCRMIFCGDPWREKQEGKEEAYSLIHIRIHLATSVSSHISAGPDQFGAWEKISSLCSLYRSQFRHQTQKSSSLHISLHFHQQHKIKHKTLNTYMQKSVNTFHLCYFFSPHLYCICKKMQKT